MVIPVVSICSWFTYLKKEPNDSTTDCLTCAEAVSLDNLYICGNKSSVTICLVKF